MNTYINFPRLHAELVSQPLPEKIICLAPTLHGKSTALESIIFAMPLSIKEATARLNAMQEQGAFLWDTGTLATVTHFSQAEAHAKKSIQEELRSLAAYEAGSSAPQKIDTFIDDVKISCQLTLLLALSLEKTLLEEQEILSLLDKAQGNLLFSLRDGAVEEKQPHHAINNDFSALPNTPETNISFTTMVAALLPFLPEECGLFTNDPTTIQELENIHEVVFEDLQNGFLQTTIPAKIFLQKKHTKLPWADKALTLYTPK